MSSSWKSQSQLQSTGTKYLQKIPLRLLQRQGVYYTSLSSSSRMLLSPSTICLHETEKQFTSRLLCLTTYKLSLNIIYNLKWCNSLCNNLCSHTSPSLIQCTRQASRPAVSTAIFSLIWRPRKTKSGMSLTRGTQLKLSWTDKLKNGEFKKNSKSNMNLKLKDEMKKEFETSLKKWERK